MTNEDDDDDDESENGLNHKQYGQMNRHEPHSCRVIGNCRNHGDHSDELEDYGDLQDYSDNDLEEEEDEDEDDEDIEEEECPDDDNISSTIGDEDDPRLRSPLTDSENKCSPSPKQTQIGTMTRSSTSSSNVASSVKGSVGKNLKSKSKSKSPENRKIHEISNLNKGTSADYKPGTTKRLADSKEIFGSENVKSQIKDTSLNIERARSLPPETSTKKMKKYNNFGLKGRKRKSRPSSSSSLMGGNSEREDIGVEPEGSVGKKETDGRLRSKKKRSCADSPPKPESNIAECKNDVETSDRLSENSTVQCKPSLMKGGEETKETTLISTSIPTPVKSSSSINTETPGLDPHNVWWANTAATTLHAPVISSGGDRTSSGGSGPILSPEISIAQWSNRGCESPLSQAGSNANVKSDSFATTMVASNSTITPPPPGPSTAMAELANLVNAHPRAGVGVTGETVHDMRPFLRNLAVQQRWASTEDARGTGVNNASCGLSDENDSGPF